MTPLQAQTHRESAVPFYLASAFLFSLSFPGLIELPGGASPGLLVMFAALPFWFEAARARKRLLDPVACLATQIIHASAFFLLLWSFLSAIGTESPLRAARYVATLAAAFAIYFMIMGSVTAPRLRLYLDIVCASLAITCAISLAGYAVDSINDLIFRGSDRAAGLFKHPNQFGMAIGTLSPALLSLLLSERRRRVFRGACLLLFYLGLVASGSKTNILITAASTLAVLFAHATIAHSGVRRIAMMALSLSVGIGLMGLGMVTLAILNPRALEIMTTFLHREGEVDSLTTRGLLWTYSLEQFVADPFFGQGAGQPIDIFYRTADVTHSHNVFLDYLRTLGAPGLCGIALILGTIAAVCLTSIWGALTREDGTVRDRLACVGLSMGSLSYIGANMSSDSFGPSTSPFFWVLVYLGFVARRLLATGLPASPGEARCGSPGTSGA